MGDEDGGDVAGDFRRELAVIELRAAIDPGSGRHGGGSNGVLDPIVYGEAAGFAVVLPFHIDGDAGTRLDVFRDDGEFVGDAARFVREGVKFAGSGVAQQGEGEIQVGG